MHKRWIVGITGASGSIYALRLLSFLAAQSIEVHAIVSEMGLRVLRDETDLSLSFTGLSGKTLLNLPDAPITFYNPKDLGALPASGSALFDGMVIVPCSVGSLGAIASGACTNLLHRSADVTLKEGRKLIMVVRETPLSAIHLENMLRLNRAGACIMPAMPGFYTRPVTITELVDHLVMKILDQMGIENAVAPRWKA